MKRTGSTTVYAFIVVSAFVLAGCSGEGSSTASNEYSSAESQWSGEITGPMTFDRPGDVAPFVTAMMTASPPRNEEFLTAIRIESDWAATVKEFELKRAEMNAELYAACMDQFGRTPTWVSRAIWPIEDWTTESMNDQQVVVVCTERRKTRTLFIKNDNGKWYISSESLWELEPIEDPQRARETIQVLEDANNQVAEIVNRIRNGALTYEQVEEKRFYNR